MLILTFSLSAPALAWEERKTDILTKTPQEVDFHTLTCAEPYMDEVEATAKAVEIGLVDGTLLPQGQVTRRGAAELLAALMAS